MLEEKIQNDLMAAMKSHKSTEVNAIRAVKTAIQLEKTIDSYHELSDNDIIRIIQKQVKERKESAKIYNDAGRDELVAIELAEADVLETLYLPKMMSKDKLYVVIDNILLEINASTMKDMGSVMKALAEKYPNQYDTKIASSYIKSKLMK